MVTLTKGDFKQVAVQFTEHSHGATAKTGQGRGVEILVNGNIYNDQGGSVRPCTLQYRMLGGPRQALAVQEQPSAGGGERCRVPVRRTHSPGASSADH